MRKIRFTFLCNDDERQLLNILASHLQRTQSDTVRCLIREATQEISFLKDGTVDHNDDNSSVKGKQNG